MTTTTDAVYIPTIISQETLHRFSSYLNVAKNIARNTDYTTATEGTVLSIPKTGAVSANLKTPGNTYTKQNPTGTNVNVTLNTHPEVTFTIDDVDKLATNQDTQQRYANDGAIALAEYVESAIFALHPSIQNTITWNRSSAATIDSSLLAIRKFFTDQKVPKLEQRRMAVDSTLMNDLLAQQKYTDQSWRGNQNTVAEGQMVRTYGFEIEENQLVPVTGSPVAYHNLAFTKDAFILASRPLPTPQGFGGNYSAITDESIGLSIRTLFWFNADLGAHQLTIELLFGVAVLDQRRVVEIESF